MKISPRRILRTAILVAAGGMAFQLNGCTNFVSNINPCGSVLACDPITYRFLTSGYRGPGADPNIDPACTYPPFCPGDPFIATQNNQP